MSADRDRAISELTGTTPINPERDTFHCMALGGVVVYLDTGTRKEIEAWMNAGPGAAYSISITDLTGSDVLVVRGRVGAIWSTAPEQREMESRFQMALSDYGTDDGASSF